MPYPVALFAAIFILCTVDVMLGEIQNAVSSPTAIESGAKFTGVVAFVEVVKYPGFVHEKAIFVPEVE